MKIAIIGAGFGGLSSAALLSHQGHEVTVIEKNEQYGGRARVHKDKGFQFDMGPSWYLMPEVFENFFKKVGKNPKDFYSLKRLDPHYRIFFSKENVIDVHADMEKNRKLFDRLEKDGGKKLDKYIGSAKEKYDASMDGPIYKDYSSIMDFLDWRILRQGMKLGVFGNLDSLVNKHFESDEAKKIMEYSIGFLGGSPKITPAVYQLMSYVDFKGGVWFPKGGMKKIADALYKISVENNAKFLMGEEAKKIITKSGKARGVKTGKRMVEADFVIVNADYPHSELELLEKSERTYDRKYWESRKLAPSAFVAYVGINKKSNKMLHHTLFLDKDWAAGFDDIFETKNPKWPSSPSYYVNIPSKTDPELAPKGGDTLFILVPLAPGLEDTPELREKFLDMILEKIEATTGEKIKKHIVSKRIFAVNDFSNDYNAYKGTALSIVHTLTQTAFWRPSHKSRKVKNLFYTGQYTHPGIGVPMTLISSEIVAGLIKR